MRYVLKVARKPRSLFGWQFYPLRVITVALAAIAFLQSSDESFVRYVLILVFLPELVVVVPLIHDALRRRRRVGRE